MITDSSVDSLIVAVLRDENPVWPQAEGGLQAERFLMRSAYHGVTALLNQRLKQLESWPEHLRQAIRYEAIAQAAWELRHQQVLTQVHAALASIGVVPVFLKGTALAYAYYSDPTLRARADTDILIQSSELRRVHNVLTSLGFELSIAISGEFVSYQASYTLAAADKGAHSIDLHWRINNSELLSRLFSYDELLEHAVSLYKLCPHALSVCPVYALILACMHRATHKQNPYYVDGVAHYSADRLIWLYDIHLLATALSPTQWHDLMRLAMDKGLRATCLDGLKRARTCFHTNVPEFKLADLAGSGDRERPADYLNASKLRQVWMDFRELELSTQLRFLQELIFPSATYMRNKYRDARSDWLPWLYARRAFSGIAKRIQAKRQV